MEDVTTSHYAKHNEKLEGCVLSRMKACQARKNRTHRPHWGARHLYKLRECRSPRFFK